MSYSEGHLFRRRHRVLPSVSNRTLHHPSFMPLYVAADFAHQHQRTSRTAYHPSIPVEFFYTDPTMGCGRRIPNMLSDLRVFDCSQLNTPPPIMSACLAPPNCPDPFRSGRHPIRDLGSPICRMHTTHPLVQPMQVVLQLTPEEDQAITNLLQLRHQEALLSAEDLSAAQMDIFSVAQPPVHSNPHPFVSHPALNYSTSAEEVYKPVCVDMQYPRMAGVRNELQQRRGWSHTELEAANTLLTRFNSKEGDQHKTAKATSDPLLCQGPETQQESDTSSPLITSDCTQSGIGATSFSRVWENGGFRPVNGRRAGDRCQPVLENRLVSSLSPRLSLRTLSDLERDAVHVLLSLADVDIVQ